MFGRGWETGQATIVALKEVWSAGRDAATDLGGKKLKSYDFVADVQPVEGGAMFRTVIHEPFDERRWVRPTVGDVVPVQCDPRRQKAKFDTSGAAAAYKAQKEEAKRERAAQATEFDALVKAAPGTSGPSIPGAVAPRAGEGVEQRMREGVANTGRILDAARKQAAGASGASSSRPTVESTAGAQPDRLERLEHLADLHDRGVLTDGEFASEKAKILGED